MKKENILIMKVGALGDVIRTTPILHKFKDQSVTWLTSESSTPLLKDNPYINRVLTIERSLKEVDDRDYALVLNMDEEQTCRSTASKLFLSKKTKKLYGYYSIHAPSNGYGYFGKNLAWFDMSMSSRHNHEKPEDPAFKNKADELKWLNTRSYEDHLFSIVGFQFNGEEFILNYGAKTKKGLVGIQNPFERISKWPMKRWNNYTALKDILVNMGHEVRFLNIHERLEDHIHDIAECEFIVCEDSLPMQIAIALRKPTVALFICTSPQEIYGYGRVKKIVSPKLKEYFYRRDFNPDAASTINIQEVLDGFKDVVNNNNSLQGTGN